VSTLTSEPSRIPLSQLRRGDRAIVETTALDDHESRLLSAMGLVDKAEIRVCRAGTPCIVQIEATRLGISAAMAARILATRCECLESGLESSLETGLKSGAL
jgi:Fe2+ transport system protein FeoA